MYGRLKAYVNRSQSEIGGVGSLVCTMLTYRDTSNSLLVSN